MDGGHQKHPELPLRPTLWKTCPAVKSSGMWASVLRACWYFLCPGCFCEHSGKVNIKEEDMLLQPWWILFCDAWNWVCQRGVQVSFKPWSLPESCAARRLIWLLTMWPGQLFSWGAMVSSFCSLHPCSNCKVQLAGVMSVFKHGNCSSCWETKVRDTWCENVMMGWHSWLSLLLKSYVYLNAYFIHHVFFHHDTRKAFSSSSAFFDCHCCFISNADFWPAEVIWVVTVMMRWCDPLARLSLAFFYCFPDYISVGL